MYVSFKLHWPIVAAVNTETGTQRNEVKAHNLLCGSLLKGLRDHSGRHCIKSDKKKNIKPGTSGLLSRHMNDYYSNCYMVLDYEFTECCNLFSDFKCIFCMLEGWNYKDE